MEIKIFSQPNCMYCKNVKDTLTENEIEFIELDISLTENREEWNKVTRLSGIGMTPTVTFGDQIWAPSRDFIDPKSLVERLKYFLENPLPVPTKDEEFQILLNATKNLSLSLQNIHKTVSTMQQKLNQLTTTPPPGPTPPPGTPVVKGEEKKETNVDEVLENLEQSKYIFFFY